MAEIPVTSIDTVENRLVRYKWSGLGQGDNGEAIRAGEAVIVSVQVLGDTSGNALVVMQGSLDEGATFVDLKGDRLGNTPIAQTIQKSFLPAIYYCRPRIEGGDVGTNIDVVLLLRDFD